MSNHPPISYEDLVNGLSGLGGLVGTIEPSRRADIQAAAEAFSGLAVVSRETLAELIGENPNWVPVLGLVVGLSQEQLKGRLQEHLGTTGHVLIARRDPLAVIDALQDDDLRVVDRIMEERHRTFGFTDILVERASSQSRAGRAIRRGRDLEDEVEALVRSLGLEFELRTQFEGRAGQTGPSDIAIPAGGANALIVCGVKGFDSTGSKLTAAFREIEQMKDVKRSNQYVFAVIDGRGWARRQGDLRRLYELWASREIDGIYSLCRFAEFREALEDAARRVRLL